MCSIDIFRRERPAIVATHLPRPDLAGSPPRSLVSGQSIPFTAISSTAISADRHLLLPEHRAASSAATHSLRAPISPKIAGDLDRLRDRPGKTSVVRLGSSSSTWPAHPRGTLRAELGIPAEAPLAARRPAWCRSRRTTFSRGARTCWPRAMPTLIHSRRRRRAVGRAAPQATARGLDAAFTSRAGARIWARSTATSTSSSAAPGTRARRCP